MQFVGKGLFRIVQVHAVRHRADRNAEITTGAIFVNQIGDVSRAATGALRRGDFLQFQRVVTRVPTGNDAKVATRTGVFVDGYFFRGRVLQQEIEARHVFVQISDDIVHRLEAH